MFTKRSFGLTTLQEVMIEKAKKALKHHPGLMDKFGAIGLGIGINPDGKNPKQIAIIFYIKKETPLTRKIPKEIDGVPTDIIIVPEGFKPL